jgi:alpha-tubulin suppressor-like RCC1 family protein
MNQKAIRLLGSWVKRIVPGLVLAVAACGGGGGSGGSSSAVSTWQNVTASESGSSFGVKTDRTLWAWGANADGQLGLGNNTLQSTPAQLGSAGGWKIVSTGKNSSSSKDFVLALKFDGTLWAWGDNAYGQLGDGSSINRAVPVQVGTDTDWTAVAAGQNFGVGLKGNGTLWWWGMMSGVLSSLSPTQFGTDTDWAKVVAAYQVMAIKTDGTLWTWGPNGNGQVGNGSTAGPVAVPYQIQPGQTWLATAASPNFSVALRSDHTIWSWGFQGYGSLGHGTDGGGGGNVTTPTQVGVATDWSSVTVGSYNTMALKQDGSLWGWGWNINSSLGDGTATKRTSPVQIGANTDWSSVVPGSSYGLGLKAGVLWGWGDNSHGALGDATATISTIPRLISP